MEDGPLRIYVRGEGSRRTELLEKLERRDGASAVGAPEIDRCCLRIRGQTAMNISASHPLSPSFNSILFLKGNLSR